MDKDPAFLFYPGDYLRDTQCLSPAAQVAYDRIMCEHMRSIPVARERVNFFIKRLNEDEKAELHSVLSQIEGGFVIEWLNVSIEKRKAYSESRRQNGIKKHILHMQSIEPAQEDENVIEDDDDKELLNTTRIIAKGMEFNFEDIWSLYPRRVGKKHALRHFKASVKNEKDLDDIRTALNNYLASERVYNGFIKNGDTWFNNWRDWVNYKEDLCKKCKGKGKYISATGYESICDCPKGRKERIG